MAEADEYDEIFAALKHPVRRQILLFLEEQGEASFTQLQNAVGIEDTGLMSYHLKELAPLVEQCARAAVITLVSSFTFYQMYLFSEGSLSGNGMPWQLGVLRAVSVMASAPAVAYVISKARRRR